MKVDEQLKCKDCDWYGSCEYYDRRKETSQICKMFNNTWKFVAELEKIKAEIEDMGWDIYKTERKVPHKYVEKKRIYELLDNRIKELKGENKQQTL